jgi:hypothetical protein
MLLTRLAGCSNAGMSLTLERKKQFLELFDFITNYKDSKLLSYQSLQILIENNTNSLDGSKVRMFVPFLKKLGFVYDHTSGDGKQINLEEFFTKDGVAYATHVKMIFDISKINKPKIENQLQKNDELFCRLGLINLIEYGETVYLELLKLLCTFSSIDRTEFFIMTTLLNQFSGQDYIDNLKLNINAYRNGELPKDLHIEKHVNAFGYVIPFIEECGFISRFEGRVKVKNKNIQVILNIIEHFGSRGL